MLVWGLISPVIKAEVRCAQTTKRVRIKQVQNSEAGLTESVFNEQLRPVFGTIQN